jgi:hypothetical protein
MTFQAMFAQRGTDVSFKEVQPFGGTFIPDRWLVRGQTLS